jgi:integrase
MYLTRHGNGYRFQRRIPVELVPILGKSPIRLNLGSVPARTAATWSRLLVANLDRLLLGILKRGHRSMPETTDPRDAIIAELHTQLADLSRTTREAAEKADEVIELQQRAHAAELEVQENRLRSEALQREKQIRIEVNEVYASSIETHANVLAALTLGRSARKQVSEQVVAPSLDALSDKLETLSMAVETMLEGGKAGPLMSKALEWWHHEIRLPLGLSGSKNDTDYNRLKDFMAFAGDKPVNRYRFSDFQKFAALLATVPTNYAKYPAFKGMSQEEAADYNDTLEPKERLPCLASGTIKDTYFSPIRMFFKDVGAEHGFRSPLFDNEIKIPKYVRGAIRRRPFKVEDLNKWFVHAAKAYRAEMKWMPLVGTLVGARVGEMVPLQGKDVYQVEGGTWVINLTTELIDDDGNPEDRRLKTASSRRIIALPDVITKTGFIKYVKTRGPEDYLFPACFYHGKERVKDPADAASKRLNNQLKAVGIHRKIESTFHSSRHNAKDIMRVARIDERTHDKQTGHAFKTVSGGYGDPLLLREEIEVIRALTLPEGLDLTPYLI